MTHDRVVDMFRFMLAVWPNKTDGWAVDSRIVNVWADALRDHDERLVGQAMRDLMHRQDRDQTWPPSLAELLTQYDVSRARLLSQGKTL